MKRKLFVLTFLCAFSFLFADYNRLGVPDSSEIRRNLVESWFEAPLSEVRMNRPEIHTNKVGQKFQIRLEETDEFFYIFAAPFATMEVDVYSDKGKSTVTQDYFPGDAAGSWLLIRDKKTGKPLKIRYYFTGNSEVYVQFFPMNGTACCDFVIFNCYAAKGVPTGLNFDRFYTASFNQVVSWTKGMVPWRYAEVFASDYSSSLRMISTVRSKLDDFLFAEDAMYDEDGSLVYITTGKSRALLPEEEGKTVVSGAGFIKWIADGIVLPIAGNRLKREPLLLQTVEYKSTGFQGILSQSYSLSFALDWVRNIASAVVSLRMNRNYLYDTSGVDVMIEPFSAVVTEKGIRYSLGFIENNGYSVECLKSLLYVLASENPQGFYMGAIRETDRHSTPEVKMFNDCVAFFPYFDKENRFQCSVFKDGAELSLDDFIRRYSSDFIYLVKLQTTDNFHPE